MLVQPHIWFSVSLVTILVSLALIIFVGPLWGIDFVGGSLIELEAPAAAAGEVQSLLATQFNLSATVQPTQNASLLIRLPAISNEQHTDILAALHEQNITSGEELRFESIGPTVGQELRRKSLTALGLVLALMIIYLAYTFRSLKGLIAPWKLGAAATYALAHDLLLVTGLFVIFGKVWEAPIDTLFVTAQLAIFGYSANDTIVIYNRFKKEWLTRSGADFLQAMDEAIKRSLGRSLNTSFTILLVLLALLFFGGSTIRWFIAALVAGTIAGSYSSIFVAPPLLYYLSQRGRKH